MSLPLFSFLEDLSLLFRDAQTQVAELAANPKALLTDDIVLAAVRVNDMEDGTVSIPTGISQPVEQAVFLKNVRVEGLSVLAERVGDDELAKLLTTIEGKDTQFKPFFCIHGFLGAPENWIYPTAKAERDEGMAKGLKMIPVLWPGINIFGPFGYRRARDEATASSRPLAKAFQKAFTALDDEGVKMDVVGTSMGNWVLKELAKARINEGDTFTFDNIFMNASDVSSEIFTSGDGQNIIDMANSDGLVIVHYNDRDSVLKLAANSPTWVRFSFLGIPIVRPVLPDFIPRLGWKGISGGQSVPGDKRKKLVQYDCTSEVRVRVHGYIFDKFLFDKFYGKKSAEIKDVEGVVKF
jgi:esterase/lipase superfamily enzyme